ncbi:hypothetical protein [Chitiniphilus eburneus]|nr:hypothetical protein [Chitiniphilus eburneus]
MIRIIEVAPAAVPVALLLLADPSRARLESYLGRSRCFIGDVGAAPAAEW